MQAYVCSPYSICTCDHFTDPITEVKVLMRMFSINCYRDNMDSKIYNTQCREGEICVKHAKFLMPIFELVAVSFFLLLLPSALA